MHLWANKNGGWIEVISGSMYSGKSEELIRRLKRAQYANQNILVIKHGIDKRYDLEKVVSHNQTELEAIPVSSVKKLREVLDEIKDEIEVIGIDEAQFFENEIVDLVDELANAGKRVILAGLDQDFKGESFHPMPELMARAEYVDKLNAICTECGNPASRTQRLVDGKPAKYNDPVVMVGASESYEARCRECHQVIKKKNKTGKLFFIVGTGTEIGKTYVTLNIIKNRIKNKKVVSAIKPVETGLELFPNYKGSDSYKYSKLLNRDIKDINLYFFTKPVSPHSAAKQDKGKIKKEKIKEKINKELSKNEEVYVEGAGGLLVPFTDNYTYLDLIEEYKKEAEIIVVSKNALGTINHTLLTIKTLKSRGIKIKGVIYNNKDKIKDEDFLDENIRIITELSG
ncbi:MAG: thymidine kinase, partial [Fusobacteriota bacterium]